jgi:hypothetical protein
MQMMYTYKELFAGFRKGQRNGNWRKLSRLEKALYRASLWYSMVREKKIRYTSTAVCAIPPK